MQGLIFSIVILFTGLILAFIAYALINKIVRPFLKKALWDNMPVLARILDDAIKAVAMLCSAFIFLFSVPYALEQAGIENSIRQIIIILLPRLCAITLILVITIAMIQVIGILFRRFRYRYAEIFSMFLQIMIVFASILTILEYIGIQATPFLEIFRVILYTICLTIALALGISIGLSIQDKVREFIFSSNAGERKKSKNKKD